MCFILASQQAAGRNLTDAPNGNNSLSPRARGEGWGEGIPQVQGFNARNFPSKKYHPGPVVTYFPPRLRPQLLRARRGRKNRAGVKMHPVSSDFYTTHGLGTHSYPEPAERTWPIPENGR